MGLSEDQLYEVRHLYSMLRVHGIRRLSLSDIAQMYDANAKATRNAVSTMCSSSVVGPAAAAAGAGKTNLFDMVRAMKDAKMGKLFVGDKAKDNPVDIGGYLDSCLLTMNAMRVPAAKRSSCSPT
jgi:ABC-type uncharacterized transport system ATPase subunit